jgi:hypothetical protein
MLTFLKISYYFIETSKFIGGTKNEEFGWTMHLHLSDKHPVKSSGHVN